MHGVSWRGLAVVVSGSLVGCASGEEPSSTGFSGTTSGPASTAVETSTSGGTSGGEASTTTGPGSDSGASGTEASGSGASAVTTGKAPLCGDGEVDPGEACDDGNQDDNDACLVGCVAASCGDGFVMAGVEACDDGNGENNDACLQTCELASCGDGFVMAGVEECDDGNDADTDGCRNVCTKAKCGDGVVWASVEACDDGNMIDDDACSHACAAASCGDGVVQGVAGEECDDGNMVDTDACLSTCKSAKCGDGVVFMGMEACDEGGMNNDATGPCKTDCTLCACQGGDVGGKKCTDLGFTCGKLACDGCGFDTSGCASPAPPKFNKLHVGPDFTGDGCWFQCEGYYDVAGGDDVPKLWGDDCMGAQFNQIRIACGPTLNQYRYVTVKKNVFKSGLAAYPEVGLITESKDQNKANFMTLNQIYATGNHPHTGASWWGSGAGCGEANVNLTVNNSCMWEAANCFGQGVNAPRYLWGYVAP